jgi:hypothetical protein
MKMYDFVRSLLSRIGPRSNWRYSFYRYQCLSSTFTSFEGQLSVPVYLWLAIEMVNKSMSRGPWRNGST